MKTGSNVATGNFYWRILAILIVLLVLSPPKKIIAQTFPSGFSQVKVATIFYPTSMAFAPDGRIFVTEKSGKVKIIKNGVLLSTPFLTVCVDQQNERGLSSVAIDPDFNTNHYVYIYYTTCSASGTIRNRLARYTANGDVAVAGSGVTILDLEPSLNSIHNGGGMEFGPDGKLYIATGNDNVNSYSQDINSYKGKVLRINRDGSIPSGNPYTGTEQAKRVWSYGLRNPWTLNFQPGTGRLFVNDVGGNSWEEINNATSSGKNFGWPAAEGFSSNTAYTNPVHAYPHGSGLNAGCAITGGTFFNPASSNYPSQYFGKYFFIDYCNRWINYIDPNNPGTRINFASNLGGALNYIKTGRDGNLYYFSISNSALYKIVFSGGSAPVITDHPDNVTVSAGQTASFSVSASGASPLSYQWRKDGVNITGANSSTYTISNVQSSHAGGYSCRVSNSFGSATSNTATLTVTAFNAAPVATINSPANGSLYRHGDIINFSGSATDTEDGTLPASSFNWTIEFHHDDHIHPGPNVADGVASGSFSTAFGETSANVFFRIILTVTDSKGATGKKSVDIFPRKSTLTINSSPQGLSILLDGIPVTTPHSVLAVSGMSRTLEAVTPQTLNGLNYAFSNWSDGGNAMRTIVITDASQSFTANYTSTGTAVCSATGSILREVWNNITGYSISSIPLGTTPSSTSQRTIFEAPSNVGDNYGQRMRGYICPPVSGNYTFWIASDDHSELWLSTNADPSTKRKIAYVTGWTGIRQWTKYSTQRSALIFLNAGQKYYIEALHKEGAQGDNLAVGWQLPNGTLERPIPGTRLSPFGITSTADYISLNSAWKYLDNGSNQGTGWRALSFDDSGWKSGNAQLGYGDGDEATVVSYGPSPTNKYVTTYFRRRFNVPTLSGVTGLQLSLQRDDGAVVYLNGTEVYRSNMPAGTITYTTTASSAIYGTAESSFIVANISKAALLAGTNMLAVEIHQQSISSSDISFNLRLRPVSSDFFTEDIAEYENGNYLAEEKAQLIAFPNPTSGIFKVELQLAFPYDNTSLVRIMDVNGKEIFKKELASNSDHFQHLIELDNSIPPGIYLVQVINGELIETTKIILSR